MYDSVTVPSTFILALTSLTIYLLGFCFYLFKKWQKCIKDCELWELKARHYSNNRLL